MANSAYEKKLLGASMLFTVLIFIFTIVALATPWSHVHWPKDDVNFNEDIEFSLFSDNGVWKNSAGESQHGGATYSQACTNGYDSPLYTDQNVIGQVANLPAGLAKCVLQTTGQVVAALVIITLIASILNVGQIAYKWARTNFLVSTRGMFLTSLVSTLCIFFALIGWGASASKPLDFLAKFTETGSGSVSIVSTGNGILIAGFLASLATTVMTFILGKPAREANFTSNFGENDHGAILAHQDDQDGL